MVEYEDTDLFPAPREVVWKLLRDHVDDAKVLVIHPLIQSQKTVSRTDTETVVDRVIDVRRKLLPSRWKLTYHPPQKARWDIVESKGPWAPGSYLDVTYDEAHGGTQITARGDLTISVLPFFLSQKRTVRSVLNDVHAEDWNYINRFRF
jgi:hypothetical protein